MGSDGHNRPAMNKIGKWDTEWVRTCRSKCVRNPMTHLRMVDCADALENASPAAIAAALRRRAQNALLGEGQIFNSVQPGDDWNSQLGT